MSDPAFEINEGVPQHALSVDVEDWNNLVVFHHCRRIVPPTQAVVRNTERLLDRILESRLRATWFVLGEIAEAFPGLIRRLADAGQEVGVHGFHHDRVSSLSEKEFRESIRRAKDTVEQASGRVVLGHRAPAFSITTQDSWAFRVLAELGFSYDSSVFPFRGRRYGCENAPLRKYAIQTQHGELTEVPLSVVRFGPWKLPCCGGGYLRHFPLAYTLWSFRSLERERRSAVVYLHPYEIDQALDKAYLRSHLGEKALAALRWEFFLQYRNRGKTMQRLRCLFSTRRFAGIAEVFHLHPAGTLQADHRG